MLVMLTAINAQAACSWPAWEQFKKDYISQQGRVIDPGDARKITTSEGQSYAMFFATAANDRPAFAQLFNWTQNNLAQGSLREHLPARLWGQKIPTLVGAGQQLRVRRRYLDGMVAAGGRSSVERDALYRGGHGVAKTHRPRRGRECAGAGLNAATGKIGFAEANSWRFNPSYLPPQLAQYFSRFGAPWSTLRETNLRLLLETAPKGFSPDWVRYESKQGWQLKAEKTLISSYDAIRVYLWAE